MAAGNLYTRTNNADTSAVPNAGSNLDAHWDTEGQVQGSIVAYTNPNLQLDIGLYLIMYSEKFYTANTTTNERVEIQGEIHVSGVGAVGGYAQDYIRKTSGQQSCAVTGSMILDVTSDNTDVFVRFYRTDDSTSGTVNRVAGQGSIIVLELDDTDNYGFYSTSSSEASSGTTIGDLNLDTNDRQDTGFSRSGDTVTITSAGRYLMTYNMDLSQANTGREDVIGYLQRNGTTPVVGSYSFCYLRGADGCQDGALCWIGIVDVSASDTIEVMWGCPTSNTITAAAGATLQIWQIPSGGDVAIMEATTGDHNAAGSFTWDTLPHIDTASFTATAGNNNIDIDQSDFALVFTTTSQAAPDSPQRPYPEHRISVDGTTGPSLAGAYHRNSGGSGLIAVNTADLRLCSPGSSIRLDITAAATTGTLTNDSAQFSVLSLASLWTYVFPPSITDQGDEQLDVGDTNELVDGANFEAVQGTGKVELGDSSDYGAATKATQTIDSWSDTQIQFDPVFTGLTDGPVWVFVTNDAGGTSLGYQVNFGVPAYTLDVLATGPDIYHPFQNSYDDATGNGFAANGQTSSGSFGFVTTPIARGDTHSWTINDANSRIEMNDSTYTNITTTHTARNIGGWIQLDKVYLVPSGFYEEGGGVNNLYFVIGFGNILLGNVADSAGSPVFKVQAFSDFKLTVDRPYHIIMEFIGGTGFTMYVDGVEVEVTDGNPITDTTMSTHSGDWSYGRPDGSLDTGGTDITYPGAEGILMAHWATWSGLGTAPLSAADIRVELFEKGAPATDVIASDTEPNMQAALDLIAPKAYVDVPLPLKVAKLTGGGSFELELEDVTFDSRCSIHVQFLGGAGETLTIINRGTSNCDVSLCSAPYGGTVTVINAVAINIHVEVLSDSSAVEGARVYLEAGTGGPLALGTLIFSGLTDASGNITTDLRFSTNQPITGKVRKTTSSPLFKTAAISGTVGASGFSTTISLLSDE